MLEPERRLVAMVTAVAVLRMLGLFMLLPVLAVWARDLPGSTPLLIGIAVSGYGITQAALQIPFGTLSDRVGRAPVIVGGLLIFVLGSLVAATAETIAWLIIGRLLQGAGAISSTLTALLADATRAEIRLRATAVLGISIGASFLLALLLGPLLAEFFSVSALFGVSAMLGAVAIALVLTLGAAGGPSRVLSVAAASTDKVLTRPLLELDITVFVLHMLLTALFVMLPFTLGDEIGLVDGRQWRFYWLAILASLAIVIPLLLGGERRREPRFLVAALVIVAAGFALLATASSSLVPVFLGTVLFFGGFNFLEAGLPAWLSMAAPVSRRGTAFGVFSSLQFLGAFAGGILGGGLLGGFELQTGYAILAAITLGSALLMRVRSAD